jgi:hypothetical protein
MSHRPSEPNLSLDFEAIRSSKSFGHPIAEHVDCVRNSLGRTTDLTRTSSRKPPGLTFPAPFDALWSYRSRPETDLNLLKAARAAIVWRSNKGWRAAIQAGRYLGWFLRFPRDLVRFLVRRGPDARQRLGRSYGGQVADMIKVAAVNGVMPRDYYVGELARHGGREALYRYVPFHLYETVARFLARERSMDDVALTRDKLVFERRCRNLGLPVVCTVAIAQPDKACRGADEGLVGGLPSTDLIAKPVNGSQGRDIEGWRSRGPDLFAEAQGQTVSSDGLASYLCGRSLKLGCAILLQERLVNHPDLAPFSGSALSTTRVITIVNEEGDPELTEAFLRTSVVPGAAIDNFHGGGVLFPIDVRTGCLGAGCGESKPLTPPIIVHPETGATVAGKPLPGWAAMSALALRAHRLFPGLLLVGWDVGYTPDGPVLVEANVPPGMTLERQALSGTLVGGRFLGLVAFHARAWLAAHEPAASRWRSAAAGPIRPGVS